jgi:SAM-dependent methyltransferase
MRESEYTYVGTELELFAGAQNWKAQWSRRLLPYLHGVVLEVGAGIGANTRYLVAPPVTRIVALEPDQALLHRLRAHVADVAVETVPTIGVLQNLPSEEVFDVIVYLDVLEHIERDRAELADASARLRPGGHLAVLAPAFQLLHSEFDRAIGHFRRYTRGTLEALAPAGLGVQRSEYLDSLGALLSLGNAMLLRSAHPSTAQIKFWDSYVIPISRATDPLLRPLFGRSVLVVWQKPQR